MYQIMMDFALSSDGPSSRFLNKISNENYLYRA